MTVCTRCGTPGTPATRFCGRCGGPLQEAAAPAGMPAGLPPGPPLGAPPNMPLRAAPSGSGPNPVLLLAGIGFVLLLLGGGGYFAWRMMGGTSSAGEAPLAAAQLYPVISKRSADPRGRGFSLGDAFYYPAALLDPTLKDVVSFSAGYSIRVTARGFERMESITSDCGTLFHKTDGMLWFHRDGRVIRNVPAIPLTCDGELLAAAKPDADKCGYVDPQTLQFRIEPKFAGCEDFSEGLAAFRLGKSEFGYIDKSGRTVIEPRFSHARPFSDGLAAVTEGPPVRGVVKFGYIDRSGKMVIPVKYEKAGPFRNGSAAVAVDQFSARMIGKNGATRGSDQYSTLIGDYREDRIFAVPRLDEPQLIDGRGTVIARMERLAFANTFFDGFAAVSIKGIKTHVDRSGKQLGTNSWDFAGDFRLGHAIVVRGEEMGLIDKTGRLVIPLAKGTLRPFEGRYCVRDTGDGFELVELGGRVAARIEDGKVIRK